MKILTLALVGAAVAYGISYITKKNENGVSILDELTQKAPEWMEKGKQYATQTINDVTENINHRNGNQS